MSDIPKYLPLSQRPRHDESGVSGNWAHHVATLLLQLAEVVEQLADEQWSTVADVANETLWQSTSTRLERLRSRKAPQLPRVQVAAGLREAAIAATGGSVKRGIRDLAIAVVGTWDIASATGSVVRVDPIASGAVALARSLSAPTPIRAVVTVRTLVATDADWRVGMGPELPATAAGIVLFLYGRGGLPAGG